MSPVHSNKNPGSTGPEPSREALTCPDVFSLTWFVLDVKKTSLSVMMKMFIKVFVALVVGNDLRWELILDEKLLGVLTQNLLHFLPAVVVLSRWRWRWRRRAPLPPLWFPGRNEGFQIMAGESGRSDDLTACITSCSGTEWKPWENHRATHTWVCECVLDPQICSAHFHSTCFPLAQFR